jgi:hypothetical protein
VTTAGGGTPSSTGPGEEQQKAAEAAARAAAERERAEKERLEKERAEKERLEKERAEKERAEREAAEEEAEAEEEEAADEPEAETGASEAAGPVDASLLYIELGPAMAASSGGASPMWAGWASVRLQPAALWSISAFGFVPFAGGTYEREEGRGHLRSYMVGLSGDIHGAYRGLELSAGVGGAWLITSIGGESDDDNSMVRAVSETESTAAAMARIGLSISLSQRFRLGARGVFGFAIPELTAKVTPPVTWGQPFVLATLALEFGLPEPKR